MMNNVTTYNNGNIRLVIQDRDREQAWNTSQNYSHTLAKYNAYLNQICLQTFKAWFEEWIKNDSNWTNNTNYSAINISELREFVNGSILQIGMTKLALIPSNDLDLEEFFVPQEWVDIPTWTADYYLDIRVNLDAEEDTCWMDILGFTTHRQLKFNGTYNKGDKTYSLSSDQLRDLEFLSLTLDLNVKAEISPLPSLELLEAKKYIEELGKRSIYSPRLHLPFEKWGALLENETYRQQLFDLRMGKVVMILESKNKPETKLSLGDTFNQNCVNLSQWLLQLREDPKNIREEIWQLSDHLLNLSKNLEPSYSRSENTTVQIENAIAAAIRCLGPGKPSDLRRQAVNDLGEIGKGNLLAIEALQKFIKIPDIDPETRLFARFNLGKIDPKNSLAATERSRLVDLGIQLSNYRVTLIVAIMQQDENKMNIMVKVQPALKNTKLPPGLNLSILDRFCETVPELEVTSRSDTEGLGKDDFLQHRFILKTGKFFKIRLSLDSYTFTEDFLV